jgi:hypothetical protein
MAGVDPPAWMNPMADHSQTQQNESSSAVEPISAEEARLLLETAIRARLGEDWDDDQSGWAVVTRHDYMAQLVREGHNVTFYVDLLGNVTVEEHGITPAQERGRLMAWLFLGGSLLTALAIARIADFI